MATFPTPFYAGVNARQLEEEHANIIRERYPKIPRRVSGCNVDQLLPKNGFHVARALVGTECTCVTVLEARLRLVCFHPKHSLLVLGYSDAYCAADHITDIRAQKPLGRESFDSSLVEDTSRKKQDFEDLKLVPKWIQLSRADFSVYGSPRAAHG
jgi:hypothetical protein